MNGAKHPPGPWDWEGREIIAARSRRVVATVSPDLLPSEAAAVRALLAAAPDFKASLAVALRALESIREPSALQWQAIREARGTLARARP